jgi:hypothetical protein
VDAGGKHETLIGLGYTLGPLIGLAGIWTAQGVGRPEQSPGFTVTLALAVGVVAVASAVRVYRRSSGRSG